MHNGDGNAYHVIVVLSPVRVALSAVLGLPISIMDSRLPHTLPDILPKMFEAYEIIAWCVYFTR